MQIFCYKYICLRFLFFKICYIFFKLCFKSVLH